MSSVLDYKQCPQCKFDQADYEYNCRTCEQYLQCRQCGYSDTVLREEDGDGKANYVCKTIHGAGVLFYRSIGAIGYSSHFLATREEIGEAEKWLREKLAAGHVRPGSAYLTRWNGETQSVDWVIGRPFEFSSYDPDDESPERLGPDDLRPFQLIEKIRSVKVRYSCGHIVDGRIALLDRQPEPAYGQVCRSVLPCLSCLPEVLKKIGRFQDFQKLKNRRTELWEYQFQDARDDQVMPAFEHPSSLEEAASLFYSAYPDRKRFFPDSKSAFKEQLKGLADEEIIITYFYAEHAGTRGIICANDFEIDLFGGIEKFATKLREQGFVEVHLLEPKEIDAAKEKVSHAPGDWSGSWTMFYPWQKRPWQATGEDVATPKVGMNHWVDESEECVTPASNSADALEESASLFYAAFPTRKRHHPESIGFELQRDGWSDEEIAEKKWLCDCTGCRAYPMTLGCRRSRK